MACGGFFVGRVNSGAARGRYDLRGASDPGGDLGRPLPSQQVRTRIVAVADPYEPKRRQLARVREDLLERELGHKRISENAYHMGRIVQAVFERASGGRLGSSSLEPSSGGDPWIKKELGLLNAIIDAETVRDYEAAIAEKLGQIGARRLRAVLGENKTFTQIAADRGLSGRAGTAFVAQSFRQDLEDLAAAWQTARGKR